MNIFDMIFSTKKIKLNSSKRNVNAFGWKTIEREREGDTNFIARVTMGCRC